MRYKLYFVLFLIFLGVNGYGQKAKILDVKDFGAAGNAIVDDYNAFKRCFETAVKSPKSVVRIPFGNYKVSRTLIVDFLYQNVSIEGVPNKDGSLPQIFTVDMSTVLWFKGFSFDSSQGIVRVKNIHLKSINPPYSEIHKGIHQDKWCAGLMITDKKRVYVENVIIENVYGQGMYIANTKQEGIPLSARFKHVEIRNCKVVNCWGYNPKQDNYGDGIYLSNVTSAIIDKNQIINDFNITNQFGRSGIVIEYMAEHCIISNNEIFGYDRGIHIEADYGGHSIIKNRISGTDLGITVFDVPIKDHNNPIRIASNSFSNNGLPRNCSFQRTRGISSRCDRALIDFIAKNGCRSGSVIEDNDFVINGEYDYYSNSVANIRADGLAFKHNTYTVLNKEKLTYDIGYFNYSVVDIKGNKFKGLRRVVLEKTKVGKYNKFSQQNQLNGAELILQDLKN